MIAKGKSPTFRGALPVRVDRDGLLAALRDLQLQPPTFREALTVRVDRDDLLAALKDLVLYLHDDDLNGPVIPELREYAMFNQIDAKARALIARLEP